MRILVTGATGFVGRWLVEELAGAGHEAIGTPPSSQFDISDPEAVLDLVRASDPDGVVHLAAVSFAGDAARDPERALRVNVGGTVAVLEALRAIKPSTAVVVIGSAEVYARPASEDLPLREESRLGPSTPYGLSKLAAEAVAVEAAVEHRQPVVVARSFNHTGPGQRSDFVVPALAGRILAAGERGEATIRAGNVDVRRDISDVRDVVRAYRLLLETLARSELGERRIFNVASGRSVPIREIAQRLASRAGLALRIETDPALVRPAEAPEIRGDATRLSDAVGWAPTIDFETTLADVLADVETRRASGRPA